MSDAIQKTHYINNAPLPSSYLDAPRTVEIVCNGEIVAYYHRTGVTPPGYPQRAVYYRRRRRTRDELDAGEKKYAHQRTVGEPHVLVESGDMLVPLDDWKDAHDQQE